MARGSVIWKNGKYMSIEEGAVSIYTHALHYGVGVFEGIRAYRQTQGGGAVFRLREHMNRFHESLHILGLQIEYSVNELCQIAVELCRKNKFEECYLRPISFVGEGPLGLTLPKDPPIDTAILSWEWGSYLGDEGIKNGVRLRTSSFNRPHVNSIMTKGKITGQYVTSVLAKREAILSGYDEGLFLDTDGYLAEGTGENLFIVKEGKIKTTPLTSVLNGITRNTSIELLQHHGHTVQEVRFSRDELWCADEVFLTGTAAEVTPVREVDNRQIGKGKPGPITLKLQKDYSDSVRGTGPDFTQEWLTQI